MYMCVNILHRHWQLAPSTGRVDLPYFSPFFFVSELLGKGLRA